MERKEVEKVVKKVIFEKMGEFNGFSNASQISDDDDLVVDMAMDSLDFVEVVMEIEKRTANIPDKVIDAKPYNELTVGGLVDMLYDYLEDK